MLTPAWEMAFLIIPPVCLAIGAFAGLLSAHSRKGTAAATLLALLNAASMAWLARENPDWVVLQSVLAVVAGVGLSVLVGLVARTRSGARG